MEIVTTESGLLEHVVFESNAEPMDSVLGDGFYLNVTFHSSDHYQSDDYAIGVEYYSLKPNAQIYVRSGCSNESPEFYEDIRNYVDGLYDPDEEKYYGLVIYNTNVLSDE